MALKLGIKRQPHRRQDAQAGVADAEFAAVRDGALRRNGWRCVDCGWKSEPKPGGRTRSSLQVHHLDDDHANNDEANLAPKCQLDHAYHHIGCDAASIGGHQGLASRMRIAAAPWISAEDLNLLQMAIGAAWGDGSQGAAAQAIYGALMQLTRPVQDVWGTHHAKDFAAALERLTPAQYEQRKVDDLRVLFHPQLLQEAGESWQQDYPLLPATSWPEVINPELLKAS